MIVKTTTAAILALVSVLPSAFAGYGHNNGHHDNRVRHHVDVGPNGKFVYEPPYVHAKAKDIVMFKFHPKNHTVTSSFFDPPCVPIPGGFTTGFIPVGPNDHPVVKEFHLPHNYDGKPIWFYCGQGNHCGQGMVFAINPPSEGPKTFAAHQALAMERNGTATPAPPRPGSPNDGSADDDDDDGDDDQDGDDEPTPQPNDNKPKPKHGSNHGYNDDNGDDGKDDDDDDGDDDQDGDDEPTPQPGDNKPKPKHGSNYGYNDDNGDDGNDDDEDGQNGGGSPPQGDDGKDEDGNDDPADDGDDDDGATPPNTPNHPPSPPTPGGQQPIAFHTATVVWGAEGHMPTGTSSADGADYTIAVGPDGSLTYDPPFIKAEVGDTVLFEFKAKNHTVTQSSFNDPCTGLVLPDGTPGFKSGFRPVPAGTTSGFPTFQITVNDTNPIWVYCGQTGHCAAGMVFSINAPAEGNTHEAFVTKAKEAGATSRTGRKHHGHHHQQKND